jgi:hypothetical protein
MGNMKSKNDFLSIDAFETMPKGKFSYNKIYHDQIHSGLNSVATINKRKSVENSMQNSIETNKHNLKQSTRPGSQIINENKAYTNFPVFVFNIFFNFLFVRVIFIVCFFRNRN